MSFSTLPAPFTSSYDNSKWVGIGGIVGYCHSVNRACTIENSVNMGSVTFRGSIDGCYNCYLYLGGIAGYLYSSGYNSTVKNCANYGDLTHSGWRNFTHIGGIVGASGSSSGNMYIYNCLNHGTITHSGTTGSSLDLGGIVGHTRLTTIENCVSGGKFSLLANASDDYTGSIVGYIESKTIISYTYYTSDLSDYDKYGNGTLSSESNTFSYDSTTFELDGTVSIESYTGSSLLGALNAYAGYNITLDYSHWLLNKENKTVSFTINGRTNPIKMDYKIILLPSLASDEGMGFDGWYSNKECTVLFEKTIVEEDIALYGRYGSEPSTAPSLFPHATLLLSFLISLIAF